MDDKKIEQLIVKTIIFFDLFDYPLTVVEIFKWLKDEKVDLGTIDLLLSSSEYIKSRVGTSCGLYFLKGRNDIVSIRSERYIIGFNKFKIAERGIFLIKLLPFIKFVGVANSIGSHNIKLNSDIDLLVVTDSNRLYLTRFMITIILNLFKLRRHKSKVSNRLCLSFYVTRDNTDLSKIKISDEDHYLSYWLANLIPIYDRDEYNSILQSNVKMLGEFKNFSGIGLKKRVIDSWVSKTGYRLSQFFLEGLFGDGLEWTSRKIQILKMLRNKKSLAKHNDTRVIINEKMLKFHENDRRQYYNNRYKQLIKEII